jgi:hypothetical protein
MGNKFHGEPTRERQSPDWRFVLKDANREIGVPGFSPIHFAQSMREKFGMMILLCLSPR